MKKFGIRFYILFNIIIICAVGVTLLGVISLKITEQFAIKGKIEGTKAIIEAFESTYYRFNDRPEGLNFLEKALDSGAWGVIIDRNGKRIFRTKGAVVNKSLYSESELNMVRNTGHPDLSVSGSSIIPFSSYKAFSIIMPIRSGSDTGSVFVYQPLNTFSDTIKSSQKLITAWIVLFILILAIFGYYLLSTTLVNPFQKLIDVTRSISKGIFPEDINIGRIAEINQLYDALGNMHSEIENKKTELERNIHDLEAANKTILKTQKELIASEKLASLGRLSAGVAHEIGNPLSAINGYVEILKKTELLSEDQRQMYLEKILSEIERINTIIKTLLDYSRPKESRVEPNDMNEIVSEAKKILVNQGIMKDINIKLDLEDQPVLVKVDRYQMLQVLINLILNSRDALNSKGEITLSTSLNKGQNPQINIEDNGPGIPEDIIDKIFDPFFTTKEPGAGTGLGLSICQRIIEQFNGSISVESTIGEGTKFSIVFAGYINEDNEINSIN